LNPKSAGAVFSREAASFFYATACAFRFLRQPSRPKPPMPVANSGSVAGSGVVVVGPGVRKSLEVTVTVTPGVRVMVSVWSAKKARGSKRSDR